MFACTRRILAFSLSLLLVAAVAAWADDWPGHLGPNRDGRSTEAGVLTSLETVGLQTVWNQPLGSGYSELAIADGVIVAMFESDGRDLVGAFDTTTGRELWRWAIGPAYPGHDGSHAGPAATPEIVGGRVFGLDRGGDLFALELATGKELWRTHLVEDHGGSKPHYGYSSSPLHVDGILVAPLNGGDGAAMAGFDAATGELMWKAGDDRIGYQSPITMSAGERDYVLAVGYTRILGIDPASGEILFSEEHGGDPGDLAGASMNPVRIGGNSVFLSHKADSSALFEVVEVDGNFGVTEVWTTNAIKQSYPVSVYHDGHIYGYNSRVLTCVDATSGEVRWRSRAPGDGFPIVVDDHLVIVTKRGSVHVARATPDKWDERASLGLFAENSWSAPSFVDGSLYVRSVGEMARIDLSGRQVTREDRILGAELPGDSEFGAFLAEVEAADDKRAVVDTFLAAQERLPLIEDGDLAIFVYRGEGEDIGIEGDMIGFRRQDPMLRVEGTDLFYYAARISSDARIAYRFVKDYEEFLVDPLNAEVGAGVFEMEFSFVAMPDWAAPAAGAEDSEIRRGTMESFELESDHFEAGRKIDVYLPAGYDESDERYPVVYVHGGGIALEHGSLRDTLDAVLGYEARPMIVVFIGVAEGENPFGDPTPFVRSVAEELIPRIDEEYRTIPEAGARAQHVTGFGINSALAIAMRYPDLVDKLGVQSAGMLTMHEQMAAAAMTAASDNPLDVYMEWGAYDLHSEHENWDMREVSIRLAELFRSRGYEPATFVNPDGWGWGAWKYGTGRVLAALFPMD